MSAVPDEQSPEVGGLQNTATNIGASLGTALAGSVLIASLTATLLAGIQTEPGRPARGERAGETCELSSGVPFLSDADLEAALEEAGVTGETAAAIVDENATARLRALRAALAVIALVARRRCSSPAASRRDSRGSDPADAKRGSPDADRHEA